MKRLILIRHAKANSSESPGGDIERTINQEGVESANQLVLTLSKEEYIPDLIIASNARRAMQTAECIQTSMSLDKTKVQSESKLYNANASEILDLIKSVDSSIDTLALVGHNPGFEDLASLLAGSQMSMGTAEAAIIDFDFGSWASCEIGQGKLTNFIQKNAN